MRTLPYASTVIDSTKLHLYPFFLKTKTKAGWLDRPSTGGGTSFCLRTAYRGLGMAAELRYRMKQRVTR